MSDLNTKLKKQKLKVQASLMISGRIESILNYRDRNEVLMNL